MRLSTVSKLLVAAAGAASLLSAPARAQSQGAHIALNNLAVVEIESQPASDQWAVQTSPGGFTGSSFYRWTGPDLFNSPGQTGFLVYRVVLGQDGTYGLRLRNRHENADSTEHNDVWLRVDGGTWFKLFSNGPGTVAQWNWDSRLDITPSNQPNADFFLTAGEHVIEFSARSFGFGMDRFHLGLLGHPDLTNEGVPPSPVSLGERVCSPAAPNSSGTPGRILALGDESVQADDLRLYALDLPDSEFGYFLASLNTSTTNVPGVPSVLCMSGQILRFNQNIQNTGASGILQLIPDLGLFPDPYNAPVLPGQTWRFQCWHRDGGGSNFTDAVAITFE